MKHTVGPVLSRAVSTATSRIAALLNRRVHAAVDGEGEDGLQWAADGMQRRMGSPSRGEMIASVKCVTVKCVCVCVLVPVNVHLCARD